MYRLMLAFALSLGLPPTGMASDVPEVLTEDNSRTIGPLGRNVEHLGDFETGAIQDKDSAHDGFGIKTLPNPQVGSESFSAITEGCCGPEAEYDTWVTPSWKPPDTGDGAAPETVAPRLGDYMMISQLIYDKDYSGFKGKTRSGFRVEGNRFGFGFGEEVWWGFSIFIPSNSECETEWTGPKGSTKFLQAQTDGASYIQWVFPQLYCPDESSEYQHWYGEVSVNPGSVRGVGDKQKLFLGSAEEDYGKWTDFVCRTRMNPFSETTHALGVDPDGQDKVYQGHRGIFQCWKSTGDYNPADEDGCVSRDFVEIVDMENEPVGTVPHDAKDMHLHWRIYKGNWKTRRTDIEGPIAFAFDEFYFGRAADGTGFEDVNPCRLPEPQ